MEKSFVHDNDSILWRFEEWFLNEGKLSLDPSGLYEIEHIYHPLDQHFYCLKIDFSGNNYIARITLWEDKSAYLEAIDLVTEDNFINRNQSDLNENDLTNQVLLFINELNNKSSDN